MKCRPSELYQIDDPIAAFCFDRAITVFGSSLEADISKATREAKPEEYERLQQKVVEWWMDPDRKSKMKTGSGQYRDPAQRMSF